MSRGGAHGGATVAQVAAQLGVHENTVSRATDRALTHLEILVTTYQRDLALRGDPLLVCIRRAAYRSFIERLMRCRPGDYPDDDPPDGV